LCYGQQASTRLNSGKLLLGALEQQRSMFFRKEDDISQESKRKLLVDNTARFYGLEKLET
jgi:hypothetical protein